MHGPSRWRPGRGTAGHYDCEARDGSELHPDATLLHRQHCVSVWILYAGIEHGVACVTEGHASEPDAIRLASMGDKRLSVLHGTLCENVRRGDDLMWWTASAPGIAMCQSVAVESHMRESRLWSMVSTIGLGIAKHVFQAHGVNAVGGRRKLRRDDVAGFFRALPPCLIGIEACPTGHHWARVLMALGHEARLMPASYIKPYVMRQKNDTTDAEAICETVARPTMPGPASN